MHVRHGMSALALAITLAGALAVILGGVPAGATTGNSVGLSKPKVTIPARDIDPMLGRFFLSQVPRGSRLISAQLDIAPQQAGEWFYGEMLLHLYAPESQHSPDRGISFEYSEGGQELSADWFRRRCDASPSGSRERWTDRVRPSIKDTGLGLSAKELKMVNGTITLNGRGPFQGCVANARAPMARLRIRCQRRSRWASAEPLSASVQHVLPVWQLINLADAGSALDEDAFGAGRDRHNLCAA